MDLMSTVWNGISNEDKDTQPKYIVDMMASAEDQREKLQREVERWCQERQVSPSA